jgi:phosphoenolpyruvate carboxylase
MLPGWYGFGLAVDAWLAEYPGGADKGRELLTEMHARWPFFRSMLSNMAMVLAKTDLAIASRYPSSVADAALRESIFARIAEEHAR